MKKSERALIILTSYDFESLQLTFKSLEHTLDQDEKIVVILNGCNSLASAIVERISRAWAARLPSYRFVVRPLCSGAKAFYAIREILDCYEPLKNVNYICKIDDDIIPIKNGWLDRLDSAYRELSEGNDLAFTTGLINNNCWGFNELLDIFNRRQEFKAMFNYKTYYSRTRLHFEAGDVNNGSFGTIWQEPYLAWWVHQWTSLDIENYVNKTMSLMPKLIPADVNYSIGCIFFKKQFWLDLDNEKYNSIFDEEIIHLTCQNDQKFKWAVMSEPILHLFYYNQRIANRDILESIIAALEIYFKDSTFKQIKRMNTAELLLNLNEELKSLNEEFITLLKAVEVEQ
jgi:hypothetical protein